VFVDVTVDVTVISGNKKITGPCNC